MAEINTKKETKTVVELKNRLEKDGITVEHIYVDGMDVGVMASISEKDRQAQLDTLTASLETIEGPVNMWAIAKAMQNLGKVATLVEHEVKADEEVTVDGKTYYIQYSKKNAVDENGEEIVNIQDLPDLPNDAAKTVLIDRLKLV